ncbi:MAG: hypothetical protein ACRESZ_11250, partial [Methylococcales bacterium]
QGRPPGAGKSIVDGFNHGSASIDNRLKNPLIHEWCSLPELKITARLPGMVIPGQPRQVNIRGNHSHLTLGAGAGYGARSSAPTKRSVGKRLICPLHLFVCINPHITGNIEI